MIFSQTRTLFNPPLIGEIGVNRCRALRLPRLACMLVLLAAPMLAQTPEAKPLSVPDPAADLPITTLKLETRLVNVSALARTHDGKPILGLTRDDFILKQDGKPQEIRFFTQGSELPLTLALMVDTSGSQRSFIDDETTASHIFFRTMLQRTEDRAVLIQFDYNILQLGRMSNSATYLEHNLQYLAEPHTSAVNQGYHHGGGGTLLFDSICTVAKLELTSQHGRRAMVILTDGGDNGSRSSLTDAIRAAQNADIVIYSVFYSRESDSRGEDVLNQLSKSTGGAVFTVGPKLTLEQIYAEIANDLRLEYELSYRPPDSAPKKYHKIDLKAKNKTLTVQARMGFYTPN